LRWLGWLVAVVGAVGMAVFTAFWASGDLSDEQGVSLVLGPAGARGCVAGLARLVDVEPTPMMTIFDLVVRVPAERMAARLRPLVRRPGRRAAGRRPARW
jgi:hypothetical protein